MNCNSCNSHTKGAPYHAYNIMCVRVFKCLFFIYLFVGLFESVGTFVFKCMCVFVCIYVFVCMYVCVWVFVCCLYPPLLTNLNLSKMLLYDRCAVSQPVLFKLHPVGFSCFITHITHTQRYREIVRKVTQEWFCVVDWRSVEWHMDIEFSKVTFVTLDGLQWLMYIVIAKSSGVEPLSNIKL